MSLEATKRLREDPDESEELRRALEIHPNDFPSEGTLVALRSAIAQRIELGDPPRLFADETDTPKELHAALLESSAEFPNREQLARLKRALDVRTSRPLSAPWRRPRVGFVALGLVLPALAAAAAGGYYLAGQGRVEPRPQTIPTHPTANPMKVSPQSTEVRELTIPTTTSPPSGSAAILAPTAKPAKSNAAPATDEYEFIRDAQAKSGRSPTESLALLNRHAKLYPSGLLAEERERLAIECLLQMGRSGEAAHRASRFHRNYPDSVHWPALQGLLERQGQVLPANE